MRPTKRGMAAMGSYVNSAGEEKKRWHECGLLFSDGERESFLLKSVPVGQWDGWIRLFDIDERSTQRKEQARRSSIQAPDLDDDIPF